MFDSKFIQNMLRNNRVLKSVDILQSTPSTNTFLKKGKFKNGHICVSAVQTAGRGQRGSKWFSEKGGLWFSFLIRKKIKQPYFYTLAAAVAVSDALLKEGIKNSLKWPNDILVNNKKISGILVENDMYSGRIITGIGINVNNKLPRNTAIPAVSVKKIIRKEYSLTGLFLKVTKKLDHYIADPGRYRKQMLDAWIKRQVIKDGKETKLVKFFKNGKAAVSRGTVRIIV